MQNKHLSEEMLSVSLDGALDERQRKLVSTHVASCLECAGKLEALRTTVLVLQQAPQVAPLRRFVLAPVAQPRVVARGYALRLAVGASMASLLAFFAITGADWMFASHQEQSSNPVLPPAISEPHPVVTSGSRPQEPILATTPTQEPSGSAPAVTAPATTQSAGTVSASSTKTVKAIRWWPLELALGSAALVFGLISLRFWRRTSL